MSERDRLNEALRLSEEQFRLLVESVQDYGIFMLDPEGLIVSWNRGAEFIKGYSKEEVLGEHFSLFYTHEDLERDYPQYELEVATQEGRFEDEGWRVRKDGTLFWANVVITALRDQKGRLVGFGKVTRDLTERRRAETDREARRQAEELAEEIQNQAALLEEQAAEMEVLNDELSASRAQLQATIDSSLEAIITTDTGSIILEWNRHAEEIFGWTAQEAIGRNLSDTIIPPQHREGHRRGVERYLSTGEGSILNERIEITALRRDGREFPVELTVATARWGGRVIFSAFIRDLTVQKRFERQRAAEHAVTRVLAESPTVTDPVPRVLAALGEALDCDTGTFWLVDPPRGLLRAEAFWHAPEVHAPGFVEMSRELTFSAGIGLPGRVWESRAPAWIANLQGDENFPRAAVAAREGLHGAFGFPVLAGEGVLGVIEFFSRAPLVFEETFLQSLEAIGRDIAQTLQRKRAERERDEALAEVSETAAEREAVLRQITDGVIFADPDGRIAFVNEAAHEMLGVTALGIPVERHAETYHLFRMDGEPYPPDDLPLSRAVRQGEAVPDAEWRVRRPDGTEVIARGSAAPVLDREGRTLGAVLTFRDVTAERKLRRELEVERTRLHELFMQAPALISVTRGPEHRIELANPIYERMAGRGELVGKTLREALPELERQGFFEMRDRVYATSRPHIQNEARVLADLDQDGVREEFFLNFVTQPLFDSDGTVGGVLTFGVDVTEQVHSRRLVEEQAAELEAHAEELQQQAVQLEKTQVELELSNDEIQRTNAELISKREEAERARAEAEAANQAKSDLLANMSHELRTPINAIVGYSDLLEMGITGPINEAQKAQLERIRVSSRHLLMLIDDILDLSKIEAGGVEVAHEPSRIGDPVDAALSLVEAQAAACGLEISGQCAGEADRLYIGDEDRVRQILINLLSNAIKFTEPGGMISVGCEIQGGAGPREGVQGADAWVCLHVQDTGIGIPSERLESVFEPFVQVETSRARTKGGTGLGLSISRNLARLMGGDLTLESEFGKGSCFTLWLPAAPAITAHG